jgi:hypothetical protein
MAVFFYILITIYFYSLFKYNFYYNIFASVVKERVR